MILGETTLEALVEAVLIQETGVKAAVVVMVEVTVEAGAGGLFLYFNLRTFDICGWLLIQFSKSSKVDCKNNFAKLTFDIRLLIWYVLGVVC